ncbi:MAG: hypothetical protein PWP57_499 [Candidatus Atribacteria bacterium]|nr:hypothetical protein [Candidatus Atribacteria bacterium]
MENPGKEEKNKMKFDVGGQALIEGVMMRSPSRLAMAVRKPNGEIVVEVKEEKPITRKYPFLSLPIIRGVASLIDSLVVGIKSLSYSASLALEEEEEKLSSMDIGISILLALGIFAGLFVALPTFLSSLVDQFISSTFAYNLVEGLIRIGIFLVYLLLISQMKDIKRVFQYHGAEHKAIFTWENGEELTPKNARKFTTLHPRCGTNWLIIVLIISIFIFSFLGRPGLVMRIVSRLLLIPLVAGLAYEAIKILSRHQDNRLAYILTLPGLLLQRITTQEPDDSQLEVAFAALKGSLGEDYYVAGENQGNS